MKTDRSTYWLALVIFLSTVHPLSAQTEQDGQHKKIFTDQKDRKDQKATGKDTAEARTNEARTYEARTYEARTYITIARYLLDKNPTFGPDLDSAGKCIKKAAEILLPAGNKDQVKEIRYLQARKFIKSHDPESARKIFMEFISRYQAEGNKKEEAGAWYQFGEDLMRVDLFTPAICSRASALQPDYVPVFLQNMDKALLLARQAGDKRLQTTILARMVSYYLTAGAYDQAATTMAQLTPLQKATSLFKPYEIAYLQILIDFWLKKDMVKVMSLSLAALKNASDRHCEADARPIQIFLGRVFNGTGDKIHAMAAFTTYMEVCRRFDKPADPTILHHCLGTLLQDPDKEAALKFVKNFDYKNPLYTSGRKFTVLKSYAEVYTALKQFDQAETYCALAQKTAETGHLSEKNEFLLEFGKLYYLWGRYDKARPFFEQAIGSKDIRISLVNTENAHLFLFKIDSATGNYQSALGQYQAVARIKDSLQGELMRKNIAELNIQYETKKKENDILLLNSKIRDQAKLQKAEAANKEKNIQLLNSQVKLEQYRTADREKSIQVLTVRDRLRDSELQRATLTSNLTIMGSVLLLIILALLFNQYRINRRNNEMVRKNNTSLQILLQDKEILMKEIHHRVKNNLQMVLSLLESQSAYLENDALLAIQSSHNRVLAMSLIHQKLYITDNTTDIELSSYLWELVTYLQDSFSTAGRIVFQMEIEPIRLDVVQAVPLGLIVNEAITNSIKYAFPGNRRGTIRISLQQDEDQLVQLHITDNGVGLPENFDVSQSSSLGLRLIKGLGNNLEADLVFERSGGTGIKIVFANIYALQGV